MRRRGIARALLKRAEALAPKMRGDGKDAPPVCIALHVSADNASARALYESAGYVEVAEEGAAKEREGGWSFPGFGGRGGSAGNGVLMVKRLASLTSS
jgi:ribosomal protein S18 acetylase RimI-like enzyme